MSVELTTKALHPWHGGWCDFFFELPNGKTGVITLRTMSNVLLEEWTNDGYGWRKELLKNGEGAYRDKDLGFNNDAEHCYTVLVKDNPPKPGLIKARFVDLLTEMDEKYGIDLQLEIPEECEEQLLHEE